MFATARHLQCVPETGTLGIYSKIQKPHRNFTLDQANNESKLNLQRKEVSNREQSFHVI